MAIFDALTSLIPAGQISSSQSFTPIQLDPKKLADCAWVVDISSPPSATATLVLEEATSQAFTTPSTLASLVVPSGWVGSRTIALGVSASAARLQNAQSAWLRCSVTTSSAFTISGSWLTKSSTNAGVGAAANDHLTLALGVQQASPAGAASPRARRPR